MLSVGLLSERRWLLLLSSTFWRHVKEFSALVNIIMQNDVILQRENIPKEKHMTHTWIPSLTISYPCSGAHRPVPCLLPPSPPRSSAPSPSAGDNGKAAGDKGWSPQGLLVLGVLCFVLRFAPGHSILCGVRHAVCKRTQRRGTGWGEGPTKYHSLSGLQSREPPLFLCISNVPGDLHLIRGSLVQLCPIQDTEERDGSSPWHSPERAEL